MTPEQWGQWERRWLELAAATGAARKRFLAVDRVYRNLGLTTEEREMLPDWDRTWGAWADALNAETRHYNAAMGRDQ